jgi:membrane protein implicated in regulation of membrane protease activity
MKKLCLGILALSVTTLGVPVLTRGNPPAAIQNDKQSDLMDIKGTVRSENAKITFVADEGGKSWDVVNPEALKNDVGKHVQVNAHVDSDKGQIHVVSVILL